MQASGRKVADEEDSSTPQLAAKALMLVGDMGFEQYRSATEYRKNKLKAGQPIFEAVSAGFGNVALLVDILEKQRHQDT